MFSKPEKTIQVNQNLNEISITKSSTKKNVTVCFDVYENVGKGKSVKKNMLPMFNKDKNYYTPSF